MTDAVGNGWIARNRSRVETGFAGCGVPTGRARLCLLA